MPIAAPETVEQALGVLENILEYSGVVAFAISGALLASRKRMDLVGVVGLGTIVAVGGGTTRDLLLGQPVFWVQNPTFAIVGAVTGLATIPLVRTGVLRLADRYHLVQLFDAAGMALFVVVGTSIALNTGANAVSAVIIGVVAGVGGGILRDVLANELPSVLTDGQFYASAALFGAVIYVLLSQAEVSRLVTVWLPIAVIFLVRGLSLRFHWGVPNIELEPGGRSE